MPFYDTQARDIALSIDISAKKPNFDKSESSEIFIPVIEALFLSPKVTRAASSHQNHVVEDVNDTVVGFNVCR